MDAIIRRLPGDVITVLVEMVDYRAKICRRYHKMDPEIVEYVHDQIEIAREYKARAVTIYDDSFEANRYMTDLGYVLLKSDWKTWYFWTSRPINVDNEWTAPRTRELYFEGEEYGSEVTRSIVQKAVAESVEKNRRFVRIELDSRSQRRALRRYAESLGYELKTETNHLFMFYY